jgi:hypothetical protein
MRVAKARATRVIVDRSSREIAPDDFDRCTVHREPAHVEHAAIEPARADERHQDGATIDRLDRA